MTGENAKFRAPVMAFVLLLGLVLRIYNFPSRYELRDKDELGYTFGGLLLWEGMTPGFKMSPAGLQTWTGWIYCAGKSAVNLLKKQETVPGPLRPFYAIDRALFEAYSDASVLKQAIIVLNLLFSLAAIWAAFQTGFRRSGIPGGLLSGGLTAVLPVFVQLTGMAKPYMTAWACAIIAHYFAANRTGKLRWAGSAVFMGLSISSRVEMLLFLPIVLWEVWNEKEPEGFRPVAFRMVGLTIGVALLISPWLVTNLIGNLRAIGTIRFSGHGTLGAMMKDFLRFEGLGLVTLIIAAGLAANKMQKPWNQRLLLGLYAFLILTMLRPSPYGLRHQGAILAAAVVVSPMALEFFRKANSKLAFCLGGALLVIPAMNSASAVREIRRLYVRDEATAWIEKNVPPGTTVYLSETFRDPLPTPQSADYLWSQVTDAQAWKTKFTQGAGRFHIPASRIPRALSEENLVQERGNRRRWFILGGTEGSREPRYDIRIISSGSPFDVTAREAVAEFKRGGVALLWRESRMDDAQILQKELGVPAVRWSSRSGKIVAVYWKRSDGDLR